MRQNLHQARFNARGLQKPQDKFIGFLSVIHVRCTEYVDQERPHETTALMICSPHTLNGVNERPSNHHDPARQGLF